MTIRVPHTFAESIRHRRLLTLSVLAIACFALALMWNGDFLYAGCPLVIYILVILSTYNLPLLYRLGPRAIYLTTSAESLAIPLSLAINFWVVWPFDRVSDVQDTHFDELPALLIRTRLNKRGFVLPILRTDAEAVALFLQSAGSGRGANAFS